MANSIEEFVLGIDIGSSAVKTSLVESSSGKIISSSISPENEEMPISSPYPGWAEQDPLMWWEHVVLACRKLKTLQPLAYMNISQIGISYQEHGLVLLDREGNVLLPAIIWCDSRTMETGCQLTNATGKDLWFDTVANEPGNFTFSKLAWVRSMLPEIYAKAATAFLPGDYIVYKLTGLRNTTKEGLSEGMLYAYPSGTLATTLLDRMGLKASLFPDLVDNFQFQGKVQEQVAAELGFSSRPSVTFRAGDQHANSVGMAVLEPGMSAGAAGTSGVIFSVTESLIVDPFSRVNSFLHVTGDNRPDRYVVVLCINSVGISYSWLRKLLSVGASRPLGYKELDLLAESSRIGSEGVILIPFGNGAERMLGNKSPGFSIVGVDLNRHTPSHIARATLEGVAYAFYYGFKILCELGLDIKVLRIGSAGLFKSRLFLKMVSSLLDIPIEIYDTDPAFGAAIGALVGAGVYPSIDDVLTQYDPVHREFPDDTVKNIMRELYIKWEHTLTKLIE